MKKEEIVTGIWPNGKVIEVGLSVYNHSYMYLSNENENYESILRKLLEAILLGKVIILEYNHGWILNVEVTNRTKKEFKRKRY